MGKTVLKTNIRKHKSTEKNKKRNGGKLMNWMYECVEDPTDAEDEYMFDEYIDMMIDRARGQD